MPYKDKTVQKKYQKAWYQIKRAEKIASGVLYRAANTIKIKESRQRSNRKNQAKRTEYTREKRRNDIQFRLRSVLRARLGRALHRRQKAGSAVRDLGVTIPEFKIYIESKFQPGMSWENHGTAWHLDHVYPLSKFNLTDRAEFLAACNYMNLQPLWVEDNLRKGNKFGGVV